MSSYNKFNNYVEAESEGIHNLSQDQLKIALTNILPVATNSYLEDITEIDYTNLSSRDITTISSEQVNGTYSIKLEDVRLDASGGNVGPFRYIVVYNDSTPDKDLICWFDYGSEFTIKADNYYVIKFDPDGLFQKI